jgi:hypothetical protein
VTLQPKKERERKEVSFSQTEETEKEGGDIKEAENETWFRVRARRRKGEETRKQKGRHLVRLGQESGKNLERSQKHKGEGKKFHRVWLGFWRSSATQKSTDEVVSESKFCF